MIISNINQQIQNTELGFSMIFEKALECRWNFQKLNDKLEQLQQSQINLKLKRNISIFKISQKDICIMCNELKEEFYSLECSHKFCTECYKTQIQIILNEDGAQKMIKATCPKKSCQVRKCLIKKII